jgi:hypothetical protein
MLPPCCPRTVRAMGAAAPVAPAPLIIKHNLSLLAMVVEKIMLEIFPIVCTHLHIIHIILNCLCQC